MSMTSDIELFGIYVPAMLFAVLLAFVLLFPARRLLARVGFYKLVALPDAFDLALYFILLAALLLALGGSTLTPLLS
jgi:Protein of unknown function (DUF1656)